MSGPTSPAAPVAHDQGITPAGAAGPANRCDSCGREIGAWDGAFCDPCADDYHDRWLDTHEAGEDEW